MVANDGGLCSAVQFYRVSLSGASGTSNVTVILKFIVLKVNNGLGETNIFNKKIKNKTQYM